MATFSTNHSRCWSFESTDSQQLGQVGTTIGESEFVQSKGRREYEGSRNNYERFQINKKIQSVKRKGGNFHSNKTSNKMSSRNVKNVSNKVDPCKVKTSALLYEITDRVNRLAQPRILRSNVSDSSESRLNVKKISEATPRILELSRPKSIYEPPSKLLYYVSPAALTAIPTERILELSRPRKNTKKVPGRKRKLVNARCNSRILHLARVKSSKQNIDDRLSKSSSRQPRRKSFRMEFQKPNKLESRRDGKESSYDQNRWKKNPRRDRRTRRRKRRTKQEPKCSSVSVKIQKKRKNK